MRAEVFDVLGPPLQDTTLDINNGT
jgi:hypothetical protein